MRSYLKFQVVDTGVGISDADIAQLFKMFGTIKRHRQMYNSKGTGLGLTISKKLTESLGGVIHIKSEEHKGTVASFTIRGKDAEPEDVDEGQLSDKVYIEGFDMFPSLVTRLLPITENKLADLPSKAATRV
eukprot:CAMPEP_0168322506 /NCGR_PEP_ID=MMETSP0213-20121227/2924_1 /TAXON_ID=151035 /ORGANISM="Euplotes harpa, Strain FSP1.4" /LENGTH=130 /DNA_ID=CAMNT_0008324395 /DNA_START=1805 /DNA_END=2198 /DNA_ORIENTATION=+